MKFIGIYNDFLDKDVFRECFEYSNSYFQEIQTKDFDLNTSSWEHNIVKDSEHIYLKNVPESELYEKIKNQLCKKLGIEIKPIINFYWYMPGSHIPWHDDHKYKGGITIYLNMHWDKDHGGYFLFEDEKTNEIRAVLPKRNMMIHQCGGIEHSVSPTTKDSKIRKTIQIFYY
jgi:Rps23 Pro-64 3,4-dihydroxylase Tpa1-like proline 4-hydroxylase